MNEPIDDDCDLSWADHMKALFKSLVRECSGRCQFDIDQAALNPEILRFAALDENPDRDVQILRRWLWEDALGFKTRLVQALTKLRRNYDRAMAAERKEREALTLREPLDVREDPEQCFDPEGVIPVADRRYVAVFSRIQLPTPPRLEVADGKPRRTIRAGQNLAPNGGKLKVLADDDEGRSHVLEIRFEDWSSLFALLNTCHHLVSVNHHDRALGSMVTLCEPGPRLTVLTETFTRQEFFTSLAYNSALELIKSWFVNLETPINEDVLVLSGSSHSVEDMMSRLGISSGLYYILCAGCGPRKVPFAMLLREDFEEALINKDFSMKVGICTKDKCGRVAFRMPRLNVFAFFTKPPTPKVSEKCPTWKGANLNQIDRAHGYRAKMQADQVDYRCRGALVNVGNRIVGVVPGPDYGWLVVDGLHPNQAFNPSENLRGEVVAYIYVSG